MDSISRKIFNRYIGKKKIDGKTAIYVKALALSLFVKHYQERSFIKEFTYDKLRKLTGLHIVTLKKYVKILLKEGYAQFLGKKKSTLLFKSIVKKNKRKNIDLSELSYESVKEVEIGLYAMGIVEIQRQKDFCLRVAIDLVNPRSLDDHKKAKRLNRAAHGKYEHFVDNGISILTIADRLGCNTQKAQKVVKYATSNNYLVRTRRVVQTYCRNAYYAFKYGAEQCTFATKHNLYLVYACTFALGVRLLSGVAPLAGNILDGEK